MLLNKKINDSINISGYSTFFYRERATKALWFAETYGLVIKELKMEDTSGSDVNITLNGNINQGNTTLLVRPDHMAIL